VRRVGATTLGAGFPGYRGVMFVSDDHESFMDKPSAQDGVWRYMDLARYLSLLEESALHFARADQMADTWEGSYGPRNQELRPGLYGEHYEMMMASVPSRRQFMRQRFHMNCWHLAEFESAAMWDIYQREGRGVAVRSTWGALTSSIRAERDVFGARVKYVDYNKTFIPERNAFDAFLYKRESFSHEREVRLIMMTGLDGRQSTIDPEPEAPVLPVAVELQKLVQDVFVAPDAPQWIGDVVEKVTARYGYGFKVRQSDLAKDPIE
jgi:hypothetical protein